MNLFIELKRRNVFKVSAAYLVLGWLVVQITDTIAPALGLPEWTLPLILWLGVIGFPFALLFAWAFELTPEGVRRTQEVSPDASITRQTGSKLNHVIIGLLLAGIVVLLADKFLSPELPTSTTATAVEPGADITPLSYDSIAVLPFANMSDDRANEHFGDGLAEELLNLLAKVDGLKVAARTSSFHFKGQNPTIGQVATALDVDTVLEGSIRRSGDTIRVVAQLISAHDNAHLWSEKYDRPLTDLFTVQDEIANQIVAALMPHLDADEQPVVSSDTGNITPEQFERFLLARHQFRDYTEESLNEAKDAFLGITKTSPGYAPAWAWLGRSWVSLERVSNGRVPASVARPAARKAIDTALALDPREPMAYVARGEVAMSADDNVDALADFERAIALDPMLVDAYVRRQDALVNVGRAEDAIESLERAREIDPLHPDVLWGLTHLLNLQGDRPAAVAALDRLYTIKPMLAAELEAHLYFDSGDMARAAYVIDLIKDGDDDESLEWRAIAAQAMGLHDAPVIQRTQLRPLSLAVLGRRDEAIAAMEEVIAGTEDAHARLHVQMQTWLALGEYERLRDVLWAAWLERQQGETDGGMGSEEIRVLAGALQTTGDPDRATDALLVTAEHVGRLSPVHSGNYLHARAALAVLEGRHDQAVSYLDALASRGDPGYWIYGTPFASDWLVADDPRYDDVRARFTANREYQLAELRRMREASLSVAEVRAEYLRASPAQAAL